MSELYVRQLQLGPKQNFIYLLGAPDAEEAAVVDAAWDVDAILAAAAQDGRRIAAAFATHSHDDHVNGLPELLRRVDVPVYVNRLELDFAEHLRAQLGEAARPAEGGDVVRVGPLEVKLLHTPGHTPGAQCLLCGGVVASGDTVFVNRCGRCDFRGGDPRAMHRSISEVLKQLPDDTRLLPGHDYGDVPISTIGREKAQNPYFQFDDVEAFVAFRMQPAQPVKG